MMKIFESASKVVFLLMTIAVIILTFVGIVDSKDFMLLASAAFTYYFTKDKGVDNM